MKLSAKQIKSIAEDLDMGMVCYIHKETGEVKTVIDTMSEFYDSTDDSWDEELAEIDRDIMSYIKLEKMHSSESFRIMADFTEEVKDQKIRDRLITALERSKPFRNFRNVLDYHDDLLQEWYVYKLERQQAWVRRELRHHLTE